MNATATDPPSPHGGPRLKTGDGDRRGAAPGGVQQAFVPTDEMRLQVTTLAKVCSADMIATTLGISRNTLYRHFSGEMQKGKAEAVSTVGAKLLQKALAGDRTCMIFYLKTQGKWSSRLELSGPGGGPIATVDLTSKLREMSDDQLAALEPLLAALLAESGDGVAGGDPFGLGTGEEGTATPGDGGDAGER
jgi:hypothetical protein